jgi:diguanylate cyclase (GGDEF)-like protein
MTENDSENLTITSTAALAQRSASLVNRGLRSLSGWDSARLIEAGKELTSSVYLDQAMHVLVKTVDAFLKPPRWSLLLLTEGDPKLYHELAIGTGSEKLRDQRIEVGSGVAGYVAQTGNAVVISDVSKDTRFTKLEASWEGAARSIIAVPLRLRGTVIGVLELLDCVGPNGLQPMDLSTLETLADFTAIALENARHVKNIHKLVITDAQTGLYNLRHLDFILDTELYRSERYNYEFSLICIWITELDHLSKTLNYSAFNALLSEIGAALKATGRLIDFVFRWDKSEINFITPQTTKENCCLVARRLHKLIRETLWLEQEGMNIRLTASVGLACFPADAKTKKELLELADEALYLVRNSSGDGVAVANIGVLPPL